MGKSAYQASIDAADEIGLAVLATTMSIVAVFLPVALMPGFGASSSSISASPSSLAVMMSLLVARMTRRRPPPILGPSPSPVPRESG